MEKQSVFSSGLVNVSSFLAVLVTFASGDDNKRYYTSSNIITIPTTETSLISRPAVEQRKEKEAFYEQFYRY